jgi:hypothetical protein
MTNIANKAHINRKLRDMVTSPRKSLELATLARRLSIRLGRLVCEHRSRKKRGPFGDCLSPEIEAAVKRAMTGFFNLGRLSNFTGKFNYGETHHAWVLHEDRPTAYRTCYSNHYYSLTTIFTLYLRSGDPDLLALGRRALVHAVSVDAIRDPGYAGFYHKGIYHWAGPTEAERSSRRSRRHPALSVSELPTDGAPFAKQGSIFAYSIVRRAVRLSTCPPDDQLGRRLIVS